MAGSPKKRERLERWKAWKERVDSMDEVCDWVETKGTLGTLRAFSQAHDFAYRTLRDWIDLNDDRSARYQTSRRRRAEVVAEEIMEIADEKPPSVTTAHGQHIDAGYVAWQKLRADNRRWAASKLDPARYGDKLELDGGLKLQHDATAEIKELLEKNGSRLPVRE